MTETTAPVDTSTPDSTAPVPATAAPAVDATPSTAPGTTLLTTETPPATETEPKADGETTGTEAKAEEKPAGAPESYEDFTLPEGVALDPEIDTKLKDTAKELGLTQEQAQKIADLGAQQASRWAADLNTQIEATSAQWVEQAKADPEIGGSNFGDTLSASKLALDRFATPELKALLETSKLGNHPEVIRLMAKVGKAISDDTFVPGGDTASPQKSVAERMFPSMTQ